MCIRNMGEMRMENKKEEIIPEEEEECKPLTDEEYEAFLKEEGRKEKKIRRIASAIWEAINFFT